ncbi:XRE family transcriptional regulator [Lactobacillus johnsonii]|uniref:XRE family transcriptional regulator n=1 Tax=Lactobacillus johnsonii TaxID=33959 RepID=UPI001FB2F889|nr:XRE family transcriptional regulator [Lactobacillus johnsonii]UOC05672.1 XRE family transcriptional regulator [Lactobacillus johnsonii]
MKLTENQVIAIKRKRGELDLSITALANTTKVSKWTLVDIFKHNHRNVTKTTFKKLNDWLINEYERSANHEANL